MDIRKVKKIIELIQESDIAELEIASEEESIRILRNTGVVNPTVVDTSSTSVMPVPVAPPPIPEVFVEDDEGEQLSGHVVRSPMVGTYYASSSPDQAPYIKVGDKVESGDTLCIIEAMKIMNQITAEKPGRVSKILVENSQPVEHDQPLFVIE